VSFPGVLGSGAYVTGNLGFDSGREYRGIALPFMFLVFLASQVLCLIFQCIYSVIHTHYRRLLSLLYL